MQLVIADTGPINYLILIGHIGILPALCEKVILPAVGPEQRVRVAGTLGILAMAAEHRLINLADAFESIKRTSFHYQQETMDKLLAETLGGV